MQSNILAGMALCLFGIGLAGCSSAPAPNTKASSVSTGPVMQEIPVGPTPLDITADWKPLTDRSTGVALKVPRDWRAKMRLVADYHEYIPGREYIGLYATAMDTPTMRLDIYRRTLDQVRREHGGLNGGSGTLIKEEISLIDGLPWTKMEYMDGGSSVGLLTETRRIVYLLERDRTTYHTSYLLTGDTAIPEAIIHSIRLGQ